MTATRMKMAATMLLALAAGYGFGARTLPGQGAAARSAAAAASIPADGSVRVLYSLDQKQNDQALIALIDDAQQHVYFAIYEFTLDDVADALVRAKERGVDV
ncbi:MAG TPA: hypothetical protein VF829_03660, partial [Candidatus Paceibacterota bacterium]